MVGKPEKDEMRVVVIHELPGPQKPGTGATRRYPSQNEPDSSDHVPLFPRFPRGLCNIGHAIRGNVINNFTISDCLLVPVFAKIDFTCSRTVPILTFRSAATSSSE